MWFNVCMLLCEKMISVGARAQVLSLVPYTLLCSHISDSSGNILSTNTEDIFRSSDYSFNRSEILQLFFVLTFKQQNVATHTVAMCVMTAV